MSATILHGDCVAMMRELPEASIDAIVTDPPYGLEFMGVAWDTFSDRPKGKPRTPNTWGDHGSREHPRNATEAARIQRNKAVALQVFSEDWAREAFRVLKPGGHLLAFGGTRTYHRMACAVEDAGFEIRDQLQWLYGSGFPKSHDVSKAIDKAAGAERERVRPVAVPASNGNGTNALGGSWQDEPWETAPATPDAERWDGWGTALKPANEPIVLARKPLSEKTVAANVLRHGTGAINVGACRIGCDRIVTRAKKEGESFSSVGGGGGFKGTAETSSIGRWPANVILSHSLFCTDDACADDCPVALLDAQSGVRKSGARNGVKRPHNDFGTFQYREHDNGKQYDASSGGASRFYYVAKAGRKERRGSKHPTVKPVALMRYLIRMIAPPGGVVLDPFAGSGTTGEAALLEGVDCVLIEREAEYIADIRARLESVAPIETAAD